MIIASFKKEPIRDTSKAENIIGTIKALSISNFNLITELRNNVCSKPKIPKEDNKEIYVIKREYTP